MTGLEKKNSGDWFIPLLYLSLFFFPNGLYNKDRKKDVIRVL
jgi:hypothetical protein